MADTNPNLQPAPVPSTGEERLESWKEIASYLKRSVRSVRRWEHAEGLPVRRHNHTRQATVFAYKSELDAWLAGRSASGRPETDPPGFSPELARPWANGLKLRSLLFGTSGLVLLLLFLYHVLLGHWMFVVRF